MKIHEYQAKELLAAAGAAVPRGIVVRNADEAVKAFDTARRQAGRPQGPGPRRRPRQGHVQGQRQGLRRRQVHQATATTSARSPRSCSSIRWSPSRPASRGRRSRKVLVQEAADIAREVYVGMVLDRAIGLPVLMACAEGGVDIEEVAARSTRRRSSRRRSIPTPACSRSRPAGWPTSSASPASRSPQGRGDHDGPGQGLPRQGLQPGRDQPAGGHAEGRRAGARRQDDLRRQRPVPPPRHRGAARRDARRTRPSCGPARRA